MSDVSPIMKWLDELARYFENRDTGGEDRAHWANVYNAENALKVKAALVASEGEVERLRDLLPIFREVEEVFMSGCSDDEIQELIDKGNSLAGLVQRIRRARAALTGETT